MFININNVGSSVSNLTAKINIDGSSRDEMIPDATEVLLTRRGTILGLITLNIFAWKQQLIFLRQRNRNQGVTEDIVYGVTLRGSAAHLWCSTWSVVAGLARARGHLGSESRHHTKPLHVTHQARVRRSSSLTRALRTLPVHSLNGPGDSYGLRRIGHALRAQ